MIFLQLKEFQPCLYWFDLLDINGNIIGFKVIK